VGISEAVLKGRKRTPDHIKEVKGTSRPDRANPDAPQPAFDLPMPPMWLNRKGVEYFGVLRTRLEMVGLATSTDTELVAVAADRMAEIDELHAVIAKEGRFFEVNGQIRSHPAVGQLNEARRHLQSLLTEFGLSPASRAKVSRPRADEKLNRFAKLNG
jgi:P27 family predicted phage terminase small subunit